MARFVFPEWTDTLKKWLGAMIAGAPVYIIALVAYAKAPETLRIGYKPVQPVPYSHALHAGELGMDCRYCHNTVDKADHAGIPPVQTCMNCHKSVLRDDKGGTSAALKPLVDAYEKPDKSLQWVSVYDLPDYVYFSHQAHVKRGVGCESCHGRVDLMVEVYQATPLTMEWCLDCHRNPDEHIRDPADVTKMGYKSAHEKTYRETALKVKDNLNINPPTYCSTCHR